MTRRPVRDAWGGRCGGVASLLAALLGLSACGTTLSDQSGSATKPATAAAAAASPVAAASPASAPADYVVQRGDTLSSLSRRHGTSVAQLASLNDLPPPYLLKVGQTLRLPGAAASPASGVMVAGMPSLPGARPATLAQGETAPVAAPRAAVTQAALPLPEPPKPLAKVEPPKPAPAPQAAKPAPNAAGRPASEPYVVPSLSSASAIPATQAAEPTVGRTPALPVAARSTSPADAQAAAAQPAAAGSLPTPPARSSSGFLMPVAGKVIAGFGPQGGGLHNDGINIAAAKGTPVKAAENGVVAYAGNELRGFGNMLLIQHAGGFMTAYAHLDSMAVQRGQRITRGQKIGAVGMSGNVTAPQLHFEIRQGKQPVDPEKQMAESSPRTAMIGQLR
jgi:murein DD-endopeptidase MepM/ murein hydrolase activator NlpD